MDVPRPAGGAAERAGRCTGTGNPMPGSVVMMPYQAYQLHQAERAKTAAEIRRADEQLGELSRALSSAWQHATRPKAVLRALRGALAVTGSGIARLAGENGPVRR